ncbi:hypothetical protein MPSEU_000021600 [Mayamaea pseudoterrestris]|nr:hypothetical protein MPSEU_000021600 [Mayamaea pseudoterrestris]
MTTATNEHETASRSSNNNHTMNPTSNRTDKENDTMYLTASVLKDLPSKTQRPRSDTDETEIGSEFTTAASTMTASEDSNAITFPLGDPRRTSNPPSWDAFVRQGSRLKSLLGETMLMVRNQHLDQVQKSNKRTNEQDNDDEQPPTSKPRMESSMPKLLQEKCTEVLRLQRLLKEANAESIALQATNTSLRDEVATTQSRLDRSQLAARISSDSAAKARADAEAAEATAASLAQALQSFQTVVDETKKATHLLQQEQQELAEATKSVEAKYLQKEADLARTQSALRTLRNEKATFDLRQAKWTYEKSDLQRRLVLTSQDLEELRKTVAERDAIESARKDRAQKVEEQLRHVQTLLKEVTSGQEDSAKTQATMQDTIMELQKANEDLHSKLILQQDASRKETARLNEALTKAEKETQTLRIQSEASDEDFERLRLDKASVDKMNSQLKSQVVRLELQLKDTAVSPPLAQANDPQRRLSTGLPFTIPPLGGGMSASGKSVGVAGPSSTCCICLEPSYGMTKRCQCGKTDCNKRAHMTCLMRSQPGKSVSHPGTPAPPLPLVLCGSVAASALKSVIGDKDA